MIWIYDERGPIVACTSLERAQHYCHVLNVASAGNGLFPRHMHYPVICL